MGRNIQGSGMHLINDMDWGYRNGLMELSISASGRMIKLMELEDFYMQMVIFILGNGVMIKLMDLEDINTLMKVNMKECGSTTDNTV